MRALVVLPSLILACCGSGVSKGSASLSGAGAFTPTFAFALAGTHVDAPADAVSIQLDDAKGSVSCVDLTGTGGDDNSSNQVKLLLENNAGASPLVVGTYVVGAASGLSAYVTTGKLTTQAASGEIAKSGSVILTAVGNSYAGTFSVITEQGELSGTFSASICH